MAKREKMLILPIRSNIQVHTQYVSLKYPRIFQTDLGSLDPSYREKLMKLGFLLCVCVCVCVFIFPCNYPSLLCHL